MTCELIGHRGARGLAPENTLAGFARAIALGVSAIECDVGLTADGVVVLSHDPALNPDITRGPDGRWLDAPGPLIRHLTYADLVTYDVGRARPGGAVARAFPDQVAVDGARMPRLVDLLSLDPSVKVYVEMKVFPDRPELTASAEQLAGAVAAVIGDAMHRVRVMSFDWRGLRWLRSAHPQIGLAWLTGALPATGDVPAAVAAEGGPVWVPEHSSITPQILREAHRLGLRVIPWTVKAPADMHRLQAWGVDGLITDRPDLFVPAQSDKTDLSTDHAIVRKFEVTAARDSSA